VVESAAAIANARGQGLCQQGDGAPLVGAVDASQVSFRAFDLEAVRVKVVALLVRGIGARDLLARWPVSKMDRHGEIGTLSGEAAHLPG